MAVDFRRVVEVAVNAAFNEEAPHELPAKRRNHGGRMRTVVAGAALVAAGRLALKKAPSLMPSLGDFTHRVADGIESAWLGDDDDRDDFDEEDEADLDDEEEDDVDEGDYDDDIDPAARPPRPPEREWTSA
jgi:hypothetical protein